MKKILVVLSLSLAFFSSVLTLPETVQKTIHTLPVEGSNNFYIIGGDISNNAVKIGAFQIQENKPILVVRYDAQSSTIPDLYRYTKTVLDDLSDSHKIAISDACFAIPGIPKGDLFLHPHLPWSTSDDAADKSKLGIDKQKLLAIAGLKNVCFVNNFQAVAMGTQVIDKTQIKTLQSGQQHPTKPILVIGAGDGLGAGMLIWNGSFYVPSPLNYSFTEFSAQSKKELAYLEYLKEKTGNLAWGKVLGSGGGIQLLYSFLDSYFMAQGADESRYAGEQFVDYKNYLDIFKNRNESARCRDAVDMYVELYARMIRNAAYAQSSYGGVYITNAVVRENPDLFAAETFIQKIVNLTDLVLDEGSRKYLEGYLSELPFSLVTSPDLELAGAAQLCMQDVLSR